MNIFLVNQDHPDATGLVQKLCNMQDKDIIRLTDGEMGLYHSPDFVHLTPDNAQQKIIQLNTDPHNAYIFILDETRDNLEDALDSIERLKLKASIVRTRP